MTAKTTLSIWLAAFAVVTVIFILFLPPGFFSNHRSSSSQQPGCNSDTLNHLYNPDRLKVLNSCETVTGTVARIIAEKDGDTHIRLKVDSQYQGLLNDYNNQYQDGSLILEIVCAYNVTQADAIDVCQGYTNTVYIPSVGQHVTVVGQYVLDQDHGWTEIHPVYSVTP